MLALQSLWTVLAWALSFAVMLHYILKILTRLLSLIIGFAVAALVILVARYFAWVSGMPTGDFAITYIYRTPVPQMIGDQLWVSQSLVLYALTLGTLVAFPIGIYAASKRHQADDIENIRTKQLGGAAHNAATGANHWCASGRAEDLFEAPQHSYTQTLIAAAPVLPDIGVHA